MRSTTKLLVGAGAAIFVVAMSSAAVADPPTGTVPAAADIVSVGANTSQGVEDQISLDYNKTKPTHKFYSWDATVGSPTIVTKKGCAAITRPNGGNAGLAALKAGAKTGTSYCVDIARQSRPPAAGDGSPALPLAFVAFAKDAVTWTANSTTNAPTSLTTTQLKAIYSCDASILGAGGSGPVTWNEVGGTSSAAVVPVIPPSGAGTRTFFLSKIGVTTPGSCVVPTDNSVDENEGTNPIFSDSDAPNEVFPYSDAVYLAQTVHNHDAGTQGNLVQHSVNGVAPTVGSGASTTINPAFPYSRLIYNVVRDNGASTHVPTALQPLLGKGNNSGYICTNATSKADLISYGFLTLGSNCGAVTKATS